MERQEEKTAPNTSTLWFAIGLGGFSVLASFFLAIYYSTLNSSDDRAEAETSSFETVNHASD
jgi:hypothetical protein